MVVLLLGIGTLYANANTQQEAVLSVRKRFTVTKLKGNCH